MSGSSTLASLRSPGLTSETVTSHSVLEGAMTAPASTACASTCTAVTDAVRDAWAATCSVVESMCCSVKAYSYCSCVPRASGPRGSAAERETVAATTQAQCRGAMASCGVAASRSTSHGPKRGRVKRGVQGCALQDGGSLLRPRNCRPPLCSSSCPPSQARPSSQLACMCRRRAQTKPSHGGVLSISVRAGVNAGRPPAPTASLPDR